MAYNIIANGTTADLYQDGSLLHSFTIPALYTRDGDSFTIYDETYSVTIDHREFSVIENLENRQAIIEQQLEYALRNSGMDAGGGVQLFTTIITDFGVNYNELIPAAGEGKYWNITNVAFSQTGGSAGIVDLTGGQIGLNGLGYNVNGLYPASSYRYAVLDTSQDFSTSITNGEVSVKVVGGYTQTSDSEFISKSVGLWLSQYGKAKTLTITDGGSGYAVNDEITLANGGVIKVTAVDTGAVTTWQWVSGASKLGADIQDSTTGSGIDFACTVDDVIPYESDNVDPTDFTGCGTLKVKVWASLETV